MGSIPLRTYGKHIATLFAFVVATCGLWVSSTSSVSAQVLATDIQVTKAVTNAPPSGICDNSLSYGASAQGDGDCASFCYKITISNDGQETLTGVTINDPD